MSTWPTTTRPLRGNEDGRQGSFVAAIAAYVRSTREVLQHEVDTSYVQPKCNSSSSGPWATEMEAAAVQPKWKWGFLTSNSCCAAKKKNQKESPTWGSCSIQSPTCCTWVTVQLFQFPYVGVHVARDITWGAWGRVGRNSFRFAHPIKRTQVLAYYSNACSSTHAHTHAKRVKDSITCATCVRTRTYVCVTCVPTCDDSKTCLQVFLIGPYVHFNRKIYSNKSSICPFCQAKK